MAPALWIDVAIAAGLVALVSLPVARVIVRRRARAAGWRQAVRELSAQLGLEAIEIPHFFDRADGDIGGHRVIVRIDPDGEGSAFGMAIEIGVRCSGGLGIKARGTSSLIDESLVGPPTPSGDAAFDQSVDLRGAPGVLLRALQQQPELRALVTGCALAGACAGANEVRLRRRGVPTAVAEIRRSLDPLLDLARRLEDPGGQHGAPPAGTPMVARIGAIARMPEEPRLLHYQAVLGEIGALIGPGQAHAMPNDKQVAWRGTCQEGGHAAPVRITVNGSSGVVLEVKVNNPHGRILLTWDPSKIEQRAPDDAWSAGDRAYVFVGKGVYLEGVPAEIDIQAARLRHLGANVTDAVARVMLEERIQYLHAHGDRIEAHFGPGLREMLDPAGQLVRAAQRCRWLAQVMQSTAADPALAQAEATTWATQRAPAQRLHCSYCRALFAAERLECPNCGAPAPA